SQQTIVTYLLHTFAGRKPMFQVGSYSAEGAQSAHYVEQVLQYNADHTRLIKQLVQFLNDTQTYGLGVLRTEFQVLRRMRTVWVPQEQRTTLGVSLGRKNVPQRQERVVYEGNAVESIDPFLFFPDPRVPMTEVNRR